MNLTLKQYSLREAFGPEFPADQHIMGFEDIDSAFVPRRIPCWLWDPKVLRDLMQWWEDEESCDGMVLFGPMGGGTLATLHQFCNSLQIPCYDKGMQVGAEFEALVQRFRVGRGQVVRIVLRNADGSISASSYTCIGIESAIAASTERRP